jgi:polar amino acid transport system permease protein
VKKKNDAVVSASKSNLNSTAWLLGLLVCGAIGFYLLFVLLSFLLKLAPEPIGSRADLFIEGAKTTLNLTLWSGAAGLIVGIFMGLAKLSKKFWLRWPADFFIWLLRGTPLLVQILFAYYALPLLVPSLRLEEFSACVIALSLNVGAYNAEVIRAGIQAIHKGQSEASLSLGLSKFQTLRFVVLPQALVIVVPPLVNNIVALLKDSSLASVIGLLELSLAGNRISSETFLPVPVLTTVALVYLSLTTAVTLFTHFLERRFK